MVHPACIPQHKFAKSGLLRVEFQQETISMDTSKYGVKKVDCFLTLLVGNDKNSHRGNISRCRGHLNIEVLLVGDHGKGEMIFLTVIILRFRTKNNKPQNH